MFFPNVRSEKCIYCVKSDQMRSFCWSFYGQWRRSGAFIVSFEHMRRRQKRQKECNVQGA